MKPVEAVAREFSDEVRIEFKQHALPSHPRAEDAAAGTMAAHEQGRFWDFHDMIFANQRALGPADLEDNARKLGLDMAKFNKTFNDQNIRQQIRSESRTAEFFGARGTPGFFINGKKQVGWGSYHGFRSMVERELKEARNLLNSGVPRNEVVKKRIQANEPTNGAKFIAHYMEGLPFSE